ncbi:unnamed protein product [Gadus morhua 'NCC']
MPALVEQGKEGLELAEGAGVLTPPTGDASDTAGPPRPGSGGGGGRAGQIYPHDDSLRHNAGPGRRGPAGRMAAQHDHGEARPNEPPPSPSACGHQG